ncbi:MAG: hypothetical protein KF795_00520 [Labilithrix sp.]|nr:hypothetical protein [Labilithrix sp.]
MIQRLSLRTLADLMKWSDEVATREFAWLRLMSRLKYDGYQDYLAGVRFLESLVTWLRQFKPEHRETAYRLVRERLVFISTPEMRRLVERFYPRDVEPRLVRAAADASNVRWYEVWANEEAVRVFERLRRQTLFVGLSDGARMDVFRRANTGIISNEQTVLGPLVDHDKWRDLGDELKKDSALTGVSDPKFTQLYLIDDLTASGTTLLRFDEVKKKWKGKLPKLRDAIWKARADLGAEFPIATNFQVCVYHYIATKAALESARALDLKARSEHQAGEWFTNVEFTAGLTLDDAARVHATDNEDAAIRDLANRYYDPVLENRHTAESGMKDMRMGYKGCALTLILEHNTPNNALSLLWADTPGANGAHAMRPLFRRRTRHV